jgi:hypothetical protein
MKDELRYMEDLYWFEIYDLRCLILGVVFFMWRAIE